jgi:hypothetical protein
LDDLSSFEYVENYANDIIVNWFMNLKCDLNCELKCVIACWGWDLNLAKYDWENSMLTDLLYYEERMCMDIR